MDFSALFSSLLLGVIEGVTEFLPISSTGHLILTTDLLGLATPPGRVLEVVIQLGAILAVCWFYRARLRQLAMGVFHERASQHFTLKLFLAFLPSAIIGLLAHDMIKTHLFSTLVVSVMLIVGGIAILLIERYKPDPHTIELEAISFKMAIAIGFFQVLAMIPGTSRSGATIMGALLMGIERKTAAEFSFFLAIPTMLAATVYDLYKNFGALSDENFISIGVGFVAAFLAALLSVRALLTFLGRHGFAPFAWYRIAVGVIMLCLLYV